MRIKATLKNQRTGQSTAVILRATTVPGGIWTMTERARRAAFKRIGADHADTNAGVTSSHQVRAVDVNGWHTYTVYASPAMTPFDGVCFVSNRIVPPIRPGHRCRFAHLASSRALRFTMYKCACGVTIKAQYHRGDK